jgi:hypothetical protein
MSVRMWAATLRDPADPGHPIRLIPATQSG